MRYPTIKMLTHDFSDRGFENIEIYPIFDLHVGLETFNEPYLQDVVAEIAEKENRFAVLGGDLIENATKDSVGDVYHSQIPIDGQPNHVAALMRPIVDRILVILPGNHCHRSKKATGQDPMFLVAALLGIVDLYMQDMAFLKIKAGSRAGHHKRPPHYSVCVTHGAGGGKGVGSGLNAAEASALALGADLLIFGHTHKPATAPIVRYECDMSKGVMTIKEVRILVATSFVNYAGYPMRGMMRPTAIRHNKAILKATEHDVAVLS